MLHKFDKRDRQLIKCQVFLSSINQVFQLRNRFLKGLETLPLNLLSTEEKNQMNLVLGFPNKKDEEEDSIRIPFIRKEGMTYDSVIHPINLTRNQKRENAKEDIDYDGKLSTPCYSERSFFGISKFNSSDRNYRDYFSDGKTCQTISIQ